MVRISRFVLCFQFIFLATSFPTSSDWLNPLKFCLYQCKGTGTRQWSLGNRKFNLLTQTSASSQAISVEYLYLKAIIALLITPSYLKIEYTVFEVHPPGGIFFRQFSQIYLPDCPHSRHFLGKIKSKIATTLVCHQKSRVYAGFSVCGDGGNRTLVQKVN